VRFRASSIYRIPRKSVSVLRKIALSIGRLWPQHYAHGLQRGHGNNVSLNAGSRDFSWKTR
jgi:hypothetical protein